MTITYFFSMIGFKFCQKEIAYYVSGDRCMILNTKILIYESLNFYLRLILLIMVLRQILVHQVALEYHGNKIINDFFTVGKKLNTNFQKCSQMFVLTWGELAIVMHSRYESPILFTLCTYT